MLSTGSGGQQVLAVFISSCHHRSFGPILISVPMRLKTTTRSTDGTAGSDSSTTFFSSTFLPFLTPPSAVMIILDCASFALSTSACEEKPEKTTEWTAPILAQASIAMGNSGTMGMYIVTLSPLLTPRLLRTLANLFTC